MYGRVHISINQNGFILTHVTSPTTCVCSGLSTLYHVKKTEKKQNEMKMVTLVYIYFSTLFQNNVSTFIMAFKQIIF